MRPNARQLALRDPAAAVMLGIIAGTNFGSEHHPMRGSGNRYGRNNAEIASFGRDHGFGSDISTSDYGADFGSSFSPMGADFDGEDPDMGADFGAAGHPSAAQLVALHKKQQAMARKTAKRHALLEPNAGSHIKVERYSFGLSQQITLGTPVNISMNSAPSVDLRPQRVTTNVPGPNFVYLSLIQVANVVITVGQGNFEDASDYANVAVGTMLDLPTLSPQNRATIAGNYFGFLPPAYINGQTSYFCLSFKGWAEIVA